MAKLTIELPYSYDQKDIAQWLADNSLTHLKSHGDYWIKSGDALRSSKGVIARVVWEGRNEVGEPHIVIANNKLSSDEMFSQFQPSVAVYESVYGGEWLKNEDPQALKKEADQYKVHPDVVSGCPRCGSYEGDYHQCPECGHGQ